MSNLFKDSNIKNVTLEEYGAMQKILKSDRGGTSRKGTSLSNVRNGRKRTPLLPGGHSHN